MAALREAMDSFSLLSKGLSAVMIGGYLMQLVMPGSKRVLALVAGRTLPCVWMVITSGLLQDNLLSLITYVVAALFLCRIIEPFYGQRELLRLLAISLFGAGTLTFILVTFLYFVAVAAGSADKSADRAGAMLYTPLCGFQGGVAALLVAMKQLIPDNDVTLLNFVHLRVKHLPALFVVGAAVVGLLMGSLLKMLPFVVFGGYTAWLYLRFFQVKGESGLRGDPAEDFRFASFFPEAVHPAVDALASAASMVTRLGRRGAGSRDSQLAGINFNVSLPDDSHTARRRERGVRALEERLGMKAAEQPGSSLTRGLSDVETGKNPT